jgi:LSU ribosomal protein L9P
MFKAYSLKSRENCRRKKKKPSPWQEKLEGLVLEIRHQAGEKGKLYGSVTSAEIAKALAEKGIEIDRKKIILTKPIKDVGIHTVSIRLHPEVEVQIKVDVQPQE